MDDLPTSTPVQPQTPQGIQPVGTVHKESAPPVGNTEAPLIQEIGKEVGLPPEVEHAGVRMQSDSIELPPPVKNMGVKAVGSPAPAPSQTTTVKLPLTDDQIAQGLSQSIFSSIRWLAEWCERQLKAAHVMVKNIKGKGVRTEV